MSEVKRIPAGDKGQRSSPQPYGSGGFLCEAISVTVAVD